MALDYVNGCSQPKDEPKSHAKEQMSWLSYLKGISVLLCFVFFNRLAEASTLI